MQHFSDTHVITRCYRRFCNLIYHECSWAYDLTSFIVSAGQWNNWRALALQYIEKGTILELGCGTGHLLKIAQEKKLPIFGLDFSAQMLQHSKKESQGEKVPLVQADGQKLPFLENSFDNIVATFPEQYITQPKTIAECARVLKNTSQSQGKIIIVGRWIVMHHWLLRHFFPVFYRLPTDSQKKDVVALFDKQNMMAKFHEHKMGCVSVYVIEATFK